MTTQENGKLMAVGSQNGLLSIIRISDNLGSVNRNDRATLNTVSIALQASNEEKSKRKPINVQVIYLPTILSPIGTHIRTSI